VFAALRRRRPSNLRDAGTFCASDAAICCEVSGPTTTQNFDPARMFFSHDFRVAAGVALPVLLKKGGGP
jgi:hypothetical protein